jgi:chloramphenicol-sensitive protein RarD
MKKNIQEYRQGLVYTAIAFTAWGVLPFYWKALKAVPAFEILGHRILWSFVLSVVILAIRKRTIIRSLLSDARNRASLITTSLLIGLNWLTYVYAVNSDRIVEASMGYYINPLFSVFLGIVFLKERLNILQVFAFILACVGVIYLTADYGKFPWISVLLASAFGLYGLLKKTSTVEALPSLMIETMLLSPIALGIIIYQMMTGRGALFNVSLGTDFLLIFAGVVTTLPLYWFAQGAKRIPLASVGFLQYITPTLMLVIGVFIYHETFSSAHFVSFGFVWLGLSLYSITLVRGQQSSA